MTAGPSNTPVVRLMVVLGCLIAAVASAIVPIPFHHFEAPHKRAVEPHKETLPDILIIGDSITLSYLPQLGRMLRGCANVEYLAQLRRQSLWRRLSNPQTVAHNARGTHHLQELLEQGLIADAVDLILINVGLHDLKHAALQEPRPSESGYAKRLERILRRLALHSEHTAFVSTTPVQAQAPNYFDNHSIRRLNRTAQQIADRLSLGYLDLQGELHRASFFKQDGYHLSGLGAEHIAHQVAAYARQILSHTMPANCAAPND